MEEKRTSAAENLGEGTRKFIPGEILIVKYDKIKFAACKGARCKFIRYFSHTDTIDVEWIRDELANGQNDGEYPADWFILSQDYDEVDRLMLQMGYQVPLP